MFKTYFETKLYSIISSPDTTKGGLEILVLCNKYECCVMNIFGSRLHNQEKNVGPAGNWCVQRSACDAEWRDEMLLTRACKVSRCSVWACSFSLRVVSCDSFSCSSCSCWARWRSFSSCSCSTDDFRHCTSAQNTAVIFSVTQLNMASTMCFVHFV